MPSRSLGSDQEVCLHCLLQFCFDLGRSAQHSADEVQNLLLDVRQLRLQMWFPPGTNASASGVSVLRPGKAIGMTWRVARREPSATFKINGSSNIHIHLEDPRGVLCAFYSTMWFQPHPPSFIGV
jgi:hypothetical protein